MGTTTLHIPQIVETDEDSYSETFGRFSLQPLEKGYGTTLGNALRRVLLSSLSGGAITSIRADGVHHEFSTIRGVVEDVADIVLNLKEVRVKLGDDRPEKVLLNLKGPHEFTAADIAKATEQFGVLNPELHIATLNEEADFSLELKITRGRGYVPASQDRMPDQPIGTIYLDAIYSPIRSVKFEVGATRVGGSTDYEKLTLEITTDGSMTPHEALRTASKILQDHIRLFVDFRLDSKSEEIQEIDEDINRIRRQLRRSIDELELSVRSHNCLEAANIHTIADLVSKNEAEMLKFKNFGRKSLIELQQKLAELNLTFDMEVDRYLGEHD